MYKSRRQVTKYWGLENKTKHKGMGRASSRTSVWFKRVIVEQASRWQYTYTEGVVWER